MLEKIVELIHKAGLQMNINSYEIIIQGLCANSELEHALDILGDMTVSVDEEGQPDENGRPTIDVRPSLQCFVPIIQLAQSLHETETAYLVLKMAEVQAGLSRIPAVVYIDLMARAADDYVVRRRYSCLPTKVDIDNNRMLTNRPFSSFLVICTDAAACS